MPRADSALPGGLAGVVVAFAAMPDQEEVERDGAAGLAMIDVNVRSTMALLEAAAALLEAAARLLPLRLLLGRGRPRPPEELRLRRHEGGALDRDGGPFGAPRAEGRHGPLREARPDRQRR